MFDGHRETQNLLRGLRGKLASLQQKSSRMCARGGGRIIFQVVRKIHIHTRWGIPPEGGEPMKYPRYVYKRLNGQEYHCGVGDSFLEEMKEKNSAADTKKASKFSISHQKQKCEYCGRLN